MSALRALEELRARSTTQYRDLLSRQKGQKDEVYKEVIGEQEEPNKEFEAVDPEADYYDEEAEEQDVTPAVRQEVDELMKEFEDEVENSRTERPGVPGIVSMMLPQALQGEEMRNLERERTPRRPEREAGGNAGQEPGQEGGLFHEPPDEDPGVESPRKKDQGSINEETKDPTGDHSNFECCSGAGSSTHTHRGRGR